MHPSRFPDQFRSGMEVKVISIAEDDLGLDLIQVAAGQGLYRPLGADRHEGRGVHHPMRGIQLPYPGFGLTALFEYFEFHNISIASPNEKKRYFSRIASWYASMIKSLPAKAETKRIKLVRGQWKLVIMAS